MKEYFAGIKTLEALKAEYKRLVKIYHPDVSGFDSTEEMKQINAQYDAMVKRIASNPAHEDFKRANTENVEMFKDLIAKLVRMAGIQIEICGTWVWVTGKTFSLKEALKAAGFRWSANKKAWYWYAPENAPKNIRRGATMEYIRERYGSKIIANDENEALTVA